MHAAATPAPLRRAWPGSLLVAGCIVLLLTACFHSASTAAPSVRSTAFATTEHFQEQPVPAPGSPIVMRFDSAVLPGLLASVAEAVPVARQGFGDSGPLVVHIYSNVSDFVASHEAPAQNQARDDVEGGVTAHANVGRIWIYGPRFERNTADQRRLIVLHEYFHTVQLFLSNNWSGSAPLWLREGSARYFEDRLGTEHGYVDFNRSKQDEVRQSRPLASLASYEQDGAARSRGGHGEAYILGFVASDYLVASRGVDGLARDLWVALASDHDWHKSFVNVFGTSTEQFYVDFESYRHTL